MADYGLIGASLGYSYSKRIHEAIFRQFGRSDLSYDLIEQDSLRLLHGYRGFNITIPYKEAVIPLLDRVEERALAMRSVNTVVFRPDGIVGYNTDLLGFEALLPADIERYRSAVILGTGASARMVADVLRSRGVETTVMVSRAVLGSKRDSKPASVLTWSYEDLELVFADRITNPGFIERPMLLVNATPVGTLGNPAPCRVKRSTIGQFDAVIDLVYNPPETELIAMARLEGAYTATGIEMLIIQAIEAQILWGLIPESEWKTDRRSFVRRLAISIQNELRL